ncbi:hypothetical protein [Desulfonatronum parangueonense]
MKKVIPAKVGIQAMLGASLNSHLFPAQAEELQDRYNRMPIQATEDFHE